MPRQLTLQPLDRGHLRFVAQLHRIALPPGLLTALGPRWLRSYYRTFVESPYGIGLVACLDSQPVGMVVGTASNAAHAAWVRRRWGRRLILLGVPALVTRPRALALLLRTRGPRVLQRLRRRTAGAARLAPAPADGVGVLAYLAVAPSARGRGIGAALVERFLREARHAGAHRVILATLSGDGGAAGFYRRLGWEHLTDRRNRDAQPVSVFGMPLAAR